MVGMVDVDVCVLRHLKKSWLGLQINGFGLLVLVIMLFKNSYSAQELKGTKKIILFPLLFGVF